MTFIKGHKNVNLRVEVSERKRKELDTIISSICNILQADEKCVLENNNSNYCCDAKYIIVKIIRDRFDKEVPYIYISKLFNRNNHSFSIHAYKRCNELLLIDNRFKEKYISVINGTS